MFSVQNYNSLADTQTGLPLAEIFYQATSTKGGAFGLIFMVWVALGPCVIGSQLSKFSLCWDLANHANVSRYWTCLLGLCSRRRPSVLSSVRPNDMDICFSYRANLGLDGHAFTLDWAHRWTHSSVLASLSLYWAAFTWDLQQHSIQWWVLQCKCFLKQRGTFYN